MNSSWKKKKPRAAALKRKMILLTAILGTGLCLHGQAFCAPDDARANYATIGKGERVDAADIPAADRKIINGAQDVYGFAMNFQFENSAQTVHKGGFSGWLWGVGMTQNVYGTVDQIHVGDKSVQNVYDGGVSGQFVTDLGGGGTQNIYAGGVGTAANLLTGGERHVFKGGHIWEPIPHGLYEIGSANAVTALNDTSKLIVSAGADTIESSVSFQSNTYDFAKASTLTLIGDNDGKTDTFSFSQLSALGYGNVAFQHHGNFGVLKVKNGLDLAGQRLGSLKFWLNTDLKNNVGDRVEISGKANGNYYVHILDASMDGSAQAITGDDLVIFKVPAASLAGNGGSFSLEAVPVDIGLFRYNIDLYENTQTGEIYFNQILPPTADSDPAKDINPGANDKNEPQDGGNNGGDGGNGGSVTPDRQLSETAMTAKNAYLTNIGAIHIENNNIMKRMGDLRASQNASGLWARTHAGKQEINVGRKADSDYWALQVGYDRKKEIDGGKLFAGIAAGRLESDTTYARGGGNTKSNSLALYGSWLGNRGHYADVILKRSWLDTDYRAFDLNGIASSAGYSGDSTSVSFEYGYKKTLSDAWFIEPQAELTYSMLSFDDYQTSNRISMHIDDVNTLTGRLGFLLGRDIGTKERPESFYLKASVARDFGDNVRARGVSNGLTALMSENIKSTWYEYGVGYTKRLGAQDHLYMDFERASGGAITAPWKINIGLRHTF